MHVKMHNVLTMKAWWCIRCSGPQRSEPAVISDSHADRKWASSFESGDGKSSSGPVIPDNQQLFVGNLPHNAEDKDLVEFFSSK